MIDEEGPDFGAAGPCESRGSRRGQFCGGIKPFREVLPAEPFLPLNEIAILVASSSPRCQTWFTVARLSVFSLETAAGLPFSKNVSRRSPQGNPPLQDSIQGVAK